MATLKKEQIMAQAITLLEQKYSYGVISKKLGCPRSWISKLANRYKQNPHETLQSLYKGGRKLVLTAATQKLIRQSKYVRGQSVKIEIGKSFECLEYNGGNSLYQSRTANIEHL